MSRSTFEKEIFVDAPPQLCSRIVFDPESFVRLHPLIQKVVDVSHGQDANGDPTCTFSPIDRLRMGPLSFNLKYKVQMTLVNGGERIDFDTYSPGGLTLRSKIHFVPEGAGTRVREEVVIEVNALLAGYSVGQAKTAHDELFANLKKYAEATK